MKKLVLVFMILVTVTCSAQENLDIVSSFKMWLLNNETKVMQTMSADAQLINYISQPFSFMKQENSLYAGCEENLWELHRKFYILLDDIQGTYNVAKRFGSGKFAIVLKQARPEIWSIYSLNSPVIFPKKEIKDTYRTAWHKTLLKALGLDSSRDNNLNIRLSTALKRLTKDELRIFTNYLDIFSALYPSNSSARMIKSFIEQSERANIGKGVIEVLKLTDPNTVVSSETFSTDIENTLEQMEELAGMKKNVSNSAEQKYITEDFSNNQQDSKTEDTSEDFNIW